MNLAILGERRTQFWFRDVRANLVQLINIPAQRSTVPFARCVFPHYFCVFRAISSAPNQTLTAIWDCTDCCFSSDQVEAIHAEFCFRQFEPRNKANLNLGTCQSNSWTWPINERRQLKDDKNYGIMIVVAVLRWEESHKNDRHRMITTRSIKLFNAFFEKFKEVYATKITQIFYEFKIQLPCSLFGTKLNYSLQLTPRSQGNQLSD